MPVLKYHFEALETLHSEVSLIGDIVVDVRRMQTDLLIYSISDQV